MRPSRLLPLDRGLGGVAHDGVAVFGGQFAREGGEQRLGGFLADAVGGQPVGEAADLDVGQRVGDEAPAGLRHGLDEGEHQAAEATGEAQGFVALVAGDGGVPQCEVDAAAQFDLEVDGIFFGARDGVELREEAGFGLRVEAGAQAADEVGEPRQGGEVEGLRPCQAPLVEAGEKQREAQRGALFAAGGAAPVGERADASLNGPGSHGTTLSRSAFFDAKEVVAESPTC